MSIVSQLVKIGQRLLGRPLSSGTRIFSVSSPEVYSPVNSQNAIEKGFEGNTAVYSIVMKDAKKFGSIPRYVYSTKSKEEKASDKIEAGALTELLNRPNKYESQDAFLTKVRAYYDICGEAMIWLNRGDISGYISEDGTLDDMAIDRLPVLEMHVLPPNYMTMIPDSTDLWGSLGWVLEAIERVVIRNNDVVHWKNTNLSFDAAARTHLRGMSPLEPGSKTLEEGNSMSKYSMRSAQNDGAKAIIFNETMNAMSPTQQTELKRVMDSKINNNDVAGAVAAIQGKWGLLNLAMSSKDLEMLDKKKFNWQELCFLFGVPYELFDSETTYANKEQAQLGWVTNEIIPACKQLDGELNRVLLKAFKLDKAAFIGTDYSELPEVQKSMIDTAKTMQEVWPLTPNEVREFMGYDKYDDEKFDVPWIPSARTPITDMTDPAEEMAQELELNRMKYERGANGNGTVSKRSGGVKV